MNDGHDGWQTKVCLWGQPIGSCQYDYTSIYSEKEVKHHILSLRPRRMCTQQMAYCLLNTNDNVADLLTKPLAGPKRSKFVKMLLHHYV